VLGQKEGLHRLAVEDLMNKRNRTKVDWYPEGAFGMCFEAVLLRGVSSSIASDIVKITVPSWVPQCMTQADR